MPPYDAGTHQAPSSCCGYDVIASSSSPCSGGLAERRSPATGSSPVTGIGGPIRIEIAVPRERSRGWSLVIIRWVPQSTIGTSGTPA